MDAETDGQDPQYANSEAQIGISAPCPEPVPSASSWASTVTVVAFAGRWREFTVLALQYLYAAHRSSSESDIDVPH